TRPLHVSAALLLAANGRPQKPSAQKEATTTTTTTTTRTPFSFPHTYLFFYVLRYPAQQTAIPSRLNASVLYATPFTYVFTIFKGRDIIRCMAYFLSSRTYDHTLEKMGGGGGVLTSHY
ncbi:unnamed protein product, partial [Ectocarpus sp. 4 AP-2014]